jgi:hypothetical protein
MCARGARQHGTPVQGGTVSPLRLSFFAFGVERLESFGLSWRTSDHAPPALGVLDVDSAEQARSSTLALK